MLTQSQTQALATQLPLTLTADDSLPDWLTINRAAPAHDEGHWRITQVRIDETSQLHHIFIEEPRTSEAVALVSNGVDEWEVALDQKPPEEPAGNHPLYPDQVYSVRLWPAASDVLHGPQLVQHVHLSFFVTFEWVPAGDEDSDDDEGHDVDVQALRAELTTAVDALDRARDLLSEE